MEDPRFADFEARISALEAALKGKQAKANTQEPSSTETPKKADAGKGTKK